MCRGEIMLTTHTKMSCCPQCGKTLDAASSLDGDNTPGEGDLSICTGCGEILVFNEDTSLRELTEKDINQIPNEVLDKLTTIQRYIRNYRNLSN